MKLSAAVLGVLVVCAPIAAAAQSPATSGVVLEQEESGSRWGALVISDTAVGFGTFVQGYDDDPFVGQALSLRPSYRIDEIPGTASLILRQDLSYEFTDPNNPSGRSFDYGDTVLWLVAPQLWTEQHTSITLGGEARLTAPISYASRAADKITALTLGPRFTRVFGDFTAQLRVLGTKHFYAHSNVGLQRDEAGDTDDGVPLAHCRAGETWCAGGAYVPSWGASLYGLLAYAFDEKLTGSLVLQYGAGWREAAPEDEFTSQATDVNGERIVQQGMQRTADTAVATIDFTYQLSEIVGLSAGVVSEMPTLTADNKRLRFHLIDFATPSNNYSSLYFDVIASF